MSSQIIAHNLKRLRSVAALSQADIAERAGMSLSGYQKLERGNANPRTDTLKALASALNTNIAELLLQVNPLQQVRFRSLKRLKSREQVIADVVVWLRDFEFLETTLNQKQPHKLAELWQAYQQFGPTQIPQFAQYCRKAFNIADNEPVHDICGLLEAKGIKVKSTTIATDAFMGLSVSSNEQGGPAIIINTWQRLSVETWIFSAAHELGHMLMHLGSYDIESHNENDQQEIEADQFASYFLMPQDAFLNEWNTTAGLPLIDRVFKIKSIFNVSWRTVLYRYAQSCDPNMRSNIWKNFNLIYKSRNNTPLLKHEEPDGISQEVYKVGFQRSVGREPFPLDQYNFQEDRLPKLVREAVESGVITLSRGAEILRISLQEMRLLATQWV